MIWRVVLAVVMALHGAVHLLGFVVPWQLAKPEGFPYKTTLLGGRIDVGDTGIRVVGVVWLLVAVGFIAAAVALLTGQSWWWVLATGTTSVSIALTILSLPEARAGVVLSVVLLALLLLLPAVRSLGESR